MRFFTALLACLFLVSCQAAGLVGEDRVSLHAVSFADVPGWQSDRQNEALAALQRSCARILKKDPASSFGVGEFSGLSLPWQEACKNIPGTSAPETARRFIEENFTPYEMRGQKGREGLFTGYYEPILKGTREKRGAYTIPIYARPADLITVSLGDFVPKLKGETVMGKVSGEKLVPYDTRADIVSGALASRGEILAWVDDPISAFFLHVQGSGRIEMEDGSVLRVGYATQNGHPYYAIGRELVKRNVLPKEEVSMQSIRAWLEAHPAESVAMMNLNVSYVFFRVLEGDGPLGGEGVALTPMRSLAVDRKLIPYGAPIFIDADAPEGNTRLQRLMVAQDTGGAITGAVRGDFFWGAGDVSARMAGIMKSKGRAWLLLPRGVSP